MNKMKSFLNICAVALCNLNLVLGLSLYESGRSIADQNITLSQWGGGYLAESTDFKADNAPILRLTSANLFSGGKMTFRKPIDAREALAKPESLLIVDYQVAGLETVLGASVKESSEANAKLKLPTKMRLAITTSDKKTSEAIITLDTNLDHQKPRVRVGVPLSSLLGINKTNQTIQEIFVALNSIATGYIHSIKIDSDLTPISATLLNDKLCRGLDEEIIFEAEASGGASVLNYVWDFGSGKSAGVSDASGSLVRKRFTLPGKYWVTVRVSDQAGFKTPASQSVLLTINP